MKTFDNWLELLYRENQSIGRTIDYIRNNPKYIDSEELSTLQHDFEYCLREATRLKELWEKENAPA
jgi:hypothetical protein